MSEAPKRKSDDTAEETRAKRAKTQDGKEAKSDNVATEIEFKQSKKPVFIVYVPEDGAPDKILGDYIDKYYVCATRKLAEAKRKAIETFGAAKLIEFVLLNHSKLKIKGKPTKRLDMGGRYLVDVPFLNKNLGYPTFHSKEKADLFVQFIEDAKSDKMLRFDETHKHLYLEYLQLGVYIQEAFEVTAA